MKNILISLISILSFSLPGQAQDSCIKLSLNADGKMFEINDITVKVYLIANGDTIFGIIKEHSLCFPKIKEKDSLEVDVYFLFDAHKVVILSVPQAFLHLSDNTTWRVGFDKKPFDKKHFWEVKDWKAIKRLDYLEIEPAIDGYATRILKRQPNR